jgi:hypothetical protein
LLPGAADGGQAVFGREAASTGLPRAGSRPYRFTNNHEGDSMKQPTPEEEQKILNSAPWGTFALMLLLGALLFAGWAFLFFGMFLEHGPVN